MQSWSAPRSRISFPRSISKCALIRCSAGASIRYRREQSRQVPNRPYPRSCNLPRVSRTIVDASGAVGIEASMFVPTDKHDPSKVDRRRQTFDIEATTIGGENMARDLYREGFAAGWLAASKKLIEAISAQQSAPAPSPLELAGNLPAQPRRRGRPPKAMTAAEPVKRKRGRPRKTEKA
jgi:AT hook motif